MKKIKIFFWRTIVMVFYPGYWYGIRIPLATRNTRGSLRIVYPPYDVHGVFQDIIKIEKKPWWLKMLLNIYHVSEEYFSFGYSTYKNGGINRIWYTLIWLCWMGGQWSVKSTIVYAIHRIGWQVFLPHPLGWCVLILYAGNWLTLVWGVRLKYLIIKYHKLHFTKKSQILKAQGS